VYNYNLAKLELGDHWDPLFLKTVAALDYCLQRDLPFENEAQFLGFLSASAIAEQSTKAPKIMLTCLHADPTKHHLGVLEALKTIWLQCMASALKQRYVALECWTDMAHAVLEAQSPAVVELGCSMLVQLAQELEPCFMLCRDLVVHCLQSPERRLNSAGLVLVTTIQSVCRPSVLARLLPLRFPSPFNSASGAVAALEEDCRHGRDVEGATRCEVCGMRGAYEWTALVLGHLVDFLLSGEAMVQARALYLVLGLTSAGQTDQGEGQGETIVQHMILMHTSSLFFARSLAAGAGIVRRNHRRLEPTASMVASYTDTDGQPRRPSTASVPHGPFDGLPSADYKDYIEPIAVKILLQLLPRPALRVCLRKSVRLHLALLFSLLSFAVSVRSSLQADNCCDTLQDEALANILLLGPDAHAHAHADIGSGSGSGVAASVAPSGGGGGKTVRVVESVTAAVRTVCELSPVVAATEAQFAVLQKAQHELQQELYLNQLLTVGGGASLSPARTRSSSLARPGPAVPATTTVGSRGGSRAAQSPGREGSARKSSLSRETSARGGSRSRKNSVNDATSGGSRRSSIARSRKSSTAGVPEPPEDEPPTPTFTFKHASAEAGAVALQRHASALQEATSMGALDAAGLNLELEAETRMRIAHSKVLHARIQMYSKFVAVRSELLLLQVCVEVDADMCAEVVALLRPLGLEVQDRGVLDLPATMQRLLRQLYGPQRDSATEAQIRDSLGTALKRLCDASGCATRLSRLNLLLLGCSLPETVSLGEHGVDNKPAPTRSSISPPQRRSPSPTRHLLTDGLFVPIAEPATPSAPISRTQSGRGVGAAPSPSASALSAPRSAAFSSPRAPETTGSTCTPMKSSRDEGRFLQRHRQLSTAEAGSGDHVDVNASSGVDSNAYINGAGCYIAGSTKLLLIKPAYSYPNPAASSAPAVAFEQSRAYKELHQSSVAGSGSVWEGGSLFSGCDESSVDLPFSQRYPRLFRSPAIETPTHTPGRELHNGRASPGQMTLGGVSATTAMEAPSCAGVGRETDGDRKSSSPPKVSSPGGRITGVSASPVPVPVSFAQVGSSNVALSQAPLPSPTAPARAMSPTPVALHEPQGGLDGPRTAASATPASARMSTAGGGAYHDSWAHYLLRKQEEYSSHCKDFQLLEVSRVSGEEPDASAMVYASNCFKTLSTKRPNIRHKNVGEKYARAMFAAARLQEDSYFLPASQDANHDKQSHGHGHAESHRKTQVSLPTPSLTIDPKWIAGGSTAPLVVGKQEGSELQRIDGV